MSDFEVIKEGNPLYAELDRLKRERDELQSAFEDAVTRAEKAEGERDALADILGRILRAHESGNDGSITGEAVLCGQFAALARAALAQVRK